jgi:hypothetical protein
MRRRLRRRRRSPSGSFGRGVGRGAGRSRLRDLRGLTCPARRVYPRTVRLRDGSACRQAANESQSEELKLLRYIPHECWCRVALRPGALRKSAPEQLRSLSPLLNGRQSAAAQCCTSLPNWQETQVVEALNPLRGALRTASSAPLHSRKCSVGAPRDSSARRAAGARWSLSCTAPVQ